MTIIDVINAFKKNEWELIYYKETMESLNKAYKKYINKHNDNVYIWTEKGDLIAIDYDLKYIQDIINNFNLYIYKNKTFVTEKMLYNKLGVDTIETNYGWDKWNIDFEVFNLNIGKKIKACRFLNKKHLN